MKARKPWIAFASGDRAVRREEGEWNVLETSTDKPINFLAVYAGKYSLYEKTFDGLTVRVAPYAGIDDGKVEQLAKLAYQIVKFYEPWLGPFPFRSLDVIELNDLGWGQAPPGMVFITKEAFNPLINRENRAYSEGINQRFAHEIAHQYWGHVVKWGRAEERWFSESFAEFCSSFIVKELQGEAGYQALLTRWRSRAEDAGDLSSIALADRIDFPNDPSESEGHRVGLVYDKGALTLALLRTQLGDQKFFSFLRNLQAQYAWRFVTTNDAVKLLRKVDADKDYGAFFDRYVWGTEMPKMPK